MPQIVVDARGVAECDARDESDNTIAPFVHTLYDSAYYLLTNDGRDAVCVETYEGKVRILVVKDAAVGLEPIWERSYDEVVTGA